MNQPRLCRVAALGMLGCFLCWGQGQIARDLLDGTTPPGIAPGAPAGSYPLSGFEEVNLYNGNLNVALPLLEVGGRGEARYTITLPIEYRWVVNRVQQCPDSGCEVFYLQNAPLTQLLVGYSPGIVEGRLGQQEEFCCSSAGSCAVMTAYTLLRLRFVAPDGSEHELRDKLTDGASQYTGRACINGQVTAGDPPFNRAREFVSADSSTMTFISDVDVKDEETIPSITPTGYLRFRDGTIYRVNRGKVERISDRNGNLIDLYYEDPVSTNLVTRITDPLNRQISIQYASSTTPYPKFDTITYPGSSGNRTIKVHYHRLASLLRDGGAVQKVKDLFPEIVNGNPAINDYPHDPPLVSKVELPNGQLYEFRYDAYAELTQVGLPTGGKYQYEFGTTTGNAGGTYGSSMVYRRVVERRVLADGTSVEGKTTFQAPQAGSAVPHVITLLRQDAGGNTLITEKHHFHGWPTDAVIIGPLNYPNWNESKEHKAEWFEGVQMSALRTVNHKWTQRGPGDASAEPPPPDATIPNDPRIVETTTTLETGQSSKQTFAYSVDKFNNLTDTYEYDFGAATYTRQTHSDYETGANYTGTDVHLRSLVKRRTVGGEVTEYFYDQQSDAVKCPVGPALLDRAGITGHDAAFGVGYATRGNLRCAARWRNTHSDWVVTRHEHDIAGNVVKTHHPKVNAPGQELSPITTLTYTDDPPGSTFAFPTQILHRTGLTTRLKYHYGIGKVTEFRDPNDKATFYSYSDPLDRLTLVTHPIGTTAFSYGTTPNNHSVITTKSLNPGSVVSEVYFDGLGRQKRSVLQEGGTSILTDRSYDALARLFRVSNPTRGTPSEWTEHRYDALGRVTSVTTPDGSVTCTAYPGNQTVVRDPAAKWRSSQTDGLGRLTKVIEDPTVNVSCGSRTGQNWETVYGYDVQDRLTSVDQGDRDRSFVYDTLGRLTSATNPESGAVSYSYDPAGNVVSRTDGRFTTSMVYDAAGRIKSKGYTDPQTPGVTYCYDGDTSGGCAGAPTGGAAQNQLGRLTMVASIQSTTKYSSYDALGRVLASSQTVAGQTHPFSYQYNDLALTQVTYPSGRVVRYEYDGAGRVKKAINGATLAAYAEVEGFDGYAPHGAIVRLLLGNGAVRELTSYSPKRLQPIQTLATKVADSSTLLNLQYSYCTTAPPGPDSGAGCTLNNGNLLGQRISFGGG